ncbi:MAG: tryptophan 7-halogenase [Pseudomonadota bacterium]
MQPYDIAIIGGGPGGSTTGALIKKYHPNLRVAIFEKEAFPREHVGESQLPPISSILHEMGCWDDVEAAGFPIKIGATYRWGQEDTLWDFEFLPIDQFKDEPRPAHYTGQRKQTAFQVERAVYDDILLRHAEKLGCEVFQQTGVKSVAKNGDQVTGLTLSDGRQIEAAYYVDASGNAAILRKAMGVDVTVPTALKNVAFWSYWENAEWAVEIGVGGTRVQVMSLGTGWLWFIPLSPTRTSIGFVCPAEHYKASGKSPEEIYLAAIASDKTICALTKNAIRETDVQGTKDWSFLADRSAGENWLMVGECAGFADPILAAGMTLTQTGAREAAYILPQVLAQPEERVWLFQHYSSTQRTRIRQHIRFADFWYTANGQFSDLQDYTAQIASDAGLKLSAKEAFRWLGTGGFTNDSPGQVGLGGLDLVSMKQITERFTDETLGWELNRYNRFKLNLKEAQETKAPVFKDGKITYLPAYVRGEKQLIRAGLFELILQVLQKAVAISDIHALLTQYFTANPGQGATPALGIYHALQTLETLVLEGWVVGSNDRRKSRLKLSTPREGSIIHTNRDERPAA